METKVMNGKMLLDAYELLEKNIEVSLKHFINESSLYSKTHTDNKCIPVNIYGYTELIVSRSGALVFLDAHGQVYSGEDLSTLDYIELLIVNEE